jgi:hypothetical protein
MGYFCIYWTFFFFVIYADCKCRLQYISYNCCITTQYFTFKYTSKTFMQISRIWMNHTLKKWFIYLYVMFYTFKSPLYLFIQATTKSFSSRKKKRKFELRGVGFADDVDPLLRLLRVSFIQIFCICKLVFSLKKHIMPQKSIVFVLSLFILEILNMCLIIY